MPSIRPSFHPRCARVAGNEFTVSDVAVGSYLLYLPLFFPDMNLKQYKNIWAYLNRLIERPHCPASYKEGVKKME